MSQAEVASRKAPHVGQRRFGCDQRLEGPRDTARIVADGPPAFAKGSS